MRDAARTIVERASILPRGVFFALGVGAAFGFGVVVAGGIGTAHGTTAPRGGGDALTTAQERAHKLDDVKVKLTYADELKKPELVHIEPLSTSKGAKAGATATPTSPAAETAPPHLEPPAPVADATAATPTQAQTPTPTPTLAPGASLAAAQRPEEGSGPPEAATASHDDEAPPERVDERRIQAALAHVLEKHDDAPPAVVQPSSKTFALQVASSPTRAGAEAAAKKIGRDARVVEGEVGGKAVFRVRLGNYPDRAAAERAKGALSTPSFIVAE